MHTLNNDNKITLYKFCQEEKEEVEEEEEYRSGG